MQPAKRYQPNPHINETLQFTHRTKQFAFAVHDIGARAEQQERAGTIRAFGFALSEVLVTDERGRPCWSPTRPPSDTPLRGPYARYPYNSLVETAQQNQFPYAENL
jgi:hypothetical protein